MTETVQRSVILESGDRLTRAEFHRRYCARPDIKRAELIEGVVYVASPTRFGVHGKQHGLMALWLGTYAAVTPGIEVGDNATVFLDADNEVQPDVCMFRVPAARHGARVTDDNYIEGAPELVGEVAASSASYDLYDKLNVYRRNSVQEYIVWRVLDNEIDWFRLREGVYQRLQPDARGVITSEVFPGLRLHVPKMLAADRAGVLAELGHVPPQSPGE